MNKPEPIRIEFIKSQPPYHPGEGARRSEKDAQVLVAIGVAKYLDPPPGLDEFGEALEPKVAPKPKPTTSRPKAKPKVKTKPKGGAKAKS